MLGRFLAAVAVFAAVEALVFHTSLYSSYLEPRSSAGTVETLIRNELKREVSNRNQVLAVGDSRMALLPRVANELNPGTGYTFASISIGGSDPRCWYYMLREVDPTARRYAAVILPVDNYDDADTWEDYADRITDLHYLIPYLRLSDLFEFSESFDSPRYKWEAFRGILFKGLVYKRDLEDFLEHPMERLAMVRLYRKGSAGWFYSYAGEHHSLKGLSVDWADRKIHFPPGLAPSQQQFIQQILLQLPAPHTGRYGAYQRYWFHKILHYYQGSGTRFLIIRLPRAPVIRPDEPAFNAHSSVRELASQRDVVVCDEHLFDVLERPDFFGDPLHMNADGLVRFSKILAREVRKDLGPPRTGRN